MPIVHSNITTAHRVVSTNTGRCQRARRSRNTHDTKADRVSVVYFIRIVLLRRLNVLDEPFPLSNGKTMLCSCVGRINYRCITNKGTLIIDP